MMGKEGERRDRKANSERAYLSTIRSSLTGAMEYTLRWQVTMGGWSLPP
jgi:hypothetical protein